MTKLNQFNQPQDSTMKALIIYGDFHSAVKANATLLYSAHKADCAVQWNIRPWRVDMLKFPPTADEALDAHLIVFAGHSTHSLPFWLERWLEQWAKHRRIKDAALAVVNAGSSEALSSASTKPDLSRFAKRHDLNVIFDDNITSIPSLIEGESSSVEGHLHEREVSVSPFLPQTLDAKTRDAYRGWSITGLRSHSCAFEAQIDGFAF
jgi:hypothetical protein